MNSVDVVEVTYCFGHLFEYTTRGCLPYYPVHERFGVLLQRDALDVVSDDVDLLRRVNQVVQFNDTRVLEALKHRNLALGCLAFHRILQSVFLIYLHCILLLISLIEAQTHSSVRSLANYTPNVIRLKLTRLLWAR